MRVIFDILQYVCECGRPEKMGVSMRVYLFGKERGSERQREREQVEGLSRAVD